MCHAYPSSIKWTGRDRFRTFEISSNDTSRPGANPARVIQQIRQKLRIPAAAVQVPIGSEDEFKGVVDLVRWKSVYNKGIKGCVLMPK
jgi:elongation factor G